MQKQPLICGSDEKLDSTLKIKNKHAIFFEITKDSIIFFNLYLSLIVYFFFFMAFFSFLPYFCIPVFFKWWNQTPSRLKLEGRAFGFLALLQTYLPVVIVQRPFTKWCYSYFLINLATGVAVFSYFVSFFN